MTFSSQCLLESLSAAAAGSKLLVGYSGGLDSHVLLHALVTLVGQQKLSIELEAIHVHHGVNKEADEWVLHCQKVCRDLNVPLIVRYVEDVPRQASLENQLRQARYRIFDSLLKAGDQLALAHHADDQAETLLMRMIRGAGPQGLSGMPPRRPLGKGHLIRPLLNVARADLEVYALEQGLSWVEDNSNQDDRFDRNYLRHKVMPQLVERWPHFRETFSRNAQVCADANHALDFFLERELLPVMQACQGGLSCQWLQGFELSVQQNLLRAWLKQLVLPLPGAKHLQQIIDEVLEAAHDASPKLTWPGVEVHRFKGVVYAFQALKNFASEGVWKGLPGKIVDVAGVGQISCQRTINKGLLIPENATVEVRFRQGGERCRVAGRDHSKPLKKLLQELGVPTWLRERVPLIYVGGELAAVADFLICEGFAANDGQQGWLVQWQRP